jgi:hypothetical protein
LGFVVDHALRRMLGQDVPDKVTQAPAALRALILERFAQRARYSEGNLIIATFHD